MNTIEKISKLVSLCKGAIFININEHRDYYDNIDEDIGDTNQEVIEEIKRRDFKVEIQAFLTAGFQVNIFHYDIDMALDIAIEEIMELYKTDLENEKRKDDPNDIFYLYNQMQKKTSMKRQVDTITLSDGTSHEGYVEGGMFYDTSGHILFRIENKNT